MSEKLGIIAIALLWDTMDARDGGIDNLVVFTMLEIAESGIRRNLVNATIKDAINASCAFTTCSPRSHSQLPKVTQHLPSISKTTDSRQEQPIDVTSLGIHYNTN